MKGLVVGIDASRGRSGGARVHLRGILGESEPAENGIREVHVWSYGALLDALPDRPWLVKHHPPQLERSLVHQVWWQYAALEGEARRAGCDIMLTTDASSVCRFSPALVMSRDMLSYEPGEMARYGFSPRRLRLLVIGFLQNRSMRRAEAVIFLTRYASRVIQESTGPLRDFRVIPHGVSPVFREARSAPPADRVPDGTLRCLYVSDVALHKHQWNVVRAVRSARGRGHRVVLTLVGSRGSGKERRLLERELAAAAAEGVVVECPGPVGHDRVAGLIAETDLYLFASSCENMPNALVEAMAVGVPIACSRRGPMPEILQDGGVYFDPEDPESIAEALVTVLEDPQLGQTFALRAKEHGAQYSWARCAQETWTYLSETARRSGGETSTPPGDESKGGR